MDDKKGFSIVAVLVGAVVIYLGNKLLGMAIPVFVLGIGPFSAPGSHPMPMRSGLPSTQTMFMVIWGAMLVAGAFVAILGGVTAGSIAPASKAEHGLGAGLVANVVPLFLMFVRMNGVRGMPLGSYAVLSSLAFPVISVLLTTGLAWLGGSLAAGGSRKQFPN